MSTSRGNARSPLALTQGDPSGIGPDITLMAWTLRDHGDRPFIAVGDPALYRARARLLNLPVPIVETDCGGAAEVFPNALPVLSTGRRVHGSPGVPVPDDAAGTLAAIEVAVEAVRRGDAAAVVTNPIAKHVLYAAGFAHPGHTEWLGELAEAKWARPVTPVMMLWSEALAVVPVTIHVPLVSVPALLTRDLIVRTGRIVERAMLDQFGLHAPRLACAGLNPHAGEAGSIGREEIDMIIPALNILRAEGVQVEGPLAADTMFHPEARARYDVALTMYHDQGLIPIKTLSFDTGVNVTLGLPFIRTSPDHGTAFALAGCGTARPDSLRAALRLASRLAAQPAA